MPRSNVPVDAGAVRFQDKRRLEAASGYNELGMFREAEAELRQIGEMSECLCEAQVLRVFVYRSLGNNALMQRTARQLGEEGSDEVQLAVSKICIKQRTGDLEIANTILLECLRWHPEKASLHYNLACLSCHLGDLRDAEKHLAHAIRLNAGFKLLALDDQDLAPLWNI